jgi:hypothetical protein
MNQLLYPIDIVVDKENNSLIMFKRKMNRGLSKIISMAQIYLTISKKRPSPVRMSKGKRAYATVSLCRFIQSFKSHALFFKSNTSVQLFQEKMGSSDGEKKNENASRK